MTGPKIQQRLVSRAELVRRVSVGKTFLYRECEKGGKLHPAMVGKNINLEHRAAKFFCAEYDYQEPDFEDEIKKAREAAAARASTKPVYDRTSPTSDVIPPDEDEFDGDGLGAVDFMDMSLRDIVRNFGRQAQFKEYVAAYKTLVVTQAAEEKMARDRKEFAHFSHIERLAMHIDGLHKMLLTDATKNIADTSKTLTVASASDEEVRKAVSKVLEQVIVMAKAQSDRIIRNAKR